MKQWWNEPNGFCDFLRGLSPGETRVASKTNALFLANRLALVDLFLDNCIASRFGEPRRTMNKE
jgi:hypothetical protein